jgi:hypothetical protein
MSRDWRVSSSPNLEATFRDTDHTDFQKRQPRKMLRNAQPEISHKHREVETSAA